MLIETDNIVTISFQNSSGKDTPQNVKISAEPPQKNKRSDRSVCLVWVRRFELPAS